MKFRIDVYEFIFRLNLQTLLQFVIDLLPPRENTTELVCCGHRDFSRQRKGKKMLFRLVNERRAAREAACGYDLTNTGSTGRRAASQCLALAPSYCNQVAATRSHSRGTDGSTHECAAHRSVIRLISLQSWRPGNPTDDMPPILPQSYATINVNIVY